MLDYSLLVGAVMLAQIPEATKDEFWPVFVSLYAMMGFAVKAHELYARLRGKGGDELEEMQTRMREVDARIGALHLSATAQMHQELKPLYERLNTIAVQVAAMSEAVQNLKEKTR